VAIYGIYGYLTKQNGWDDPTQGTFRIFSIYGSPPSLALYLSVVFPLALYRTITAQGIIRIVGLIGILLLLAATGLTFTRSAFLAIPFSILIMVFFLPSRRLKIAILSTFMLLTLVIVFLAGAVHIPIFIRFFQQDFTTLNGRTNIWQALLARFDPTRLLGAGLGASNAILGNLGVNGVTGITNYESHNLYLGILYDHGVIGGVLLITIFVTLLVSMILGIRRTTGKHQLLFVTAFATSVSVVLQSVQTNDIFILSIGLYFWVIVALPFAYCWPSTKSRSKTLEVVSEDEANSETVSMKGR
jgi:O-antigen ligase